MSGVLIGDKHTYKDWGLIWTEAAISVPEPYTQKQEVPFRDGKLDLTKFLSPITKYKNRTLTLGFVLDDRNMEYWHELYSKIANYLQGEDKKVILDTDANFYYIGQCSCEIVKTDAVMGGYTITVDCDPYKYERYSSLEPWLWDPFNFENGIIRNYKDITVDGKLTLVIPGRKKAVAPVFDCSVEMDVIYNGLAYTLPQGKSTVTDIVLGEGEHELTFVGHGVISVDYRGGSL